MTVKCSFHPFYFLPSDRSFPPFYAVITYTIVFLTYLTNTFYIIPLFLMISSYLYSIIAFA
jgi:hypothetical protein